MTPLNMRSLIVATLALALSGCAFWGDSNVPEPATDNGLAGAEANYDKISDKIDSRVAAAIVTAKGNANDEKIVTGELAVAEAMLEAPKPDDLAWAKARAEKGDDAFYAEQVKQSRELAAAMIAAAKKYEAEKARKQAEHEAALKAKDAELKAMELSKNNDRLMIAGGALLMLGLGLMFFSPLAKGKQFGGALLVLGTILGGIPFVSGEAWFKQSIGWTIGIVVIGILAWLFLSRKKDCQAAEDDSNSRTIN